MGVTTPTQPASGGTLASLEGLNVTLLAFAVAYARMRARDEFRERSVGLAAIVLSTVVGCSVWASLSANPSTYAKILVGFLSVLAAVFGAVNRWTPFTGASARQRKAEKSCNDLRTEVLDALDKLKDGAITVGEAEGRFVDIRDRYDAVKGRKDTPGVSRHVFTKAHRWAEEHPYE